MKAIKDNKVYSITEQEVKGYKSRGFDIYDNKGKLKEHGAGKAISAEKYEALEKENARLKKALEKMKNENSKDEEQQDEKPDKK